MIRIGARSLGQGAVHPVMVIEDITESCASITATGCGLILSLTSTQHH